MNNKGFAISIVLYSMVLLMTTVLFVMLGTIKNRYNTNTNLKETVISELGSQTKTCEWFNIENIKELSSCEETPKNNEPQENDVYNTCSSYLGDKYTYSLTRTECIDGSVVNSIKSSEEYDNENDALDACFTQINNRCPNGIKNGGECYSSKVILYMQKNYIYKCS